MDNVEVKSQDSEWKFFFFKIFQKGSNKGSERRNTKKENEGHSGQMRIHTKTQKDQIFKEKWVETQ